MRVTKKPKIGKNHVTEMVVTKDTAICWIMLFLTIAEFNDGCPQSCVCPLRTNDVSCVSRNLTVIPRNLPKMAATLDFTNNFIDSVMGVEMEGFRHLLTLNFENNMIQNVQDGAFIDLESLQTLDLSHNRLAIVTEQTLAGVTQITTLDLSNNLIQHIDGTFAKMTHLTRIDLSYNQIQRISQVSFRDLRKLRYLMLSDNQISHIDKKAFRTLDQLMYLVLRGNPIHRVAKFEFNSRFLSYVDLSECGLEQIPRGLPATIRYLQLRRNNITLLHRRSFRDCPHVSILVLDENGIVSVDDRTFEEMLYLQQLWLNGNKLTQVPYPLPVGLQRLLLDQNRIHRLENVFPADSELTKLSLMGNNLTYLAHDALAHLRTLESLDLSENNLSHIYGHTFKHQMNLTFLQLSKNPLTHFHGRSFWGLRSLRTLSLAYINTHVAMHHNVFSHIHQLQKLSLDSSPKLVETLLSGRPFIHTFQTVQDLSLQSCELSWLSPAFPGWFTHLTTLHVSSTRWHCDTNLMWFRDWLLTTNVTVWNPEEIACFTPRKTHSRSIVSLKDSEFIAATRPPRTTSTTARPLSTFPTAEESSAAHSKPQRPSEGTYTDGQNQTLKYTGITQKPLLPTITQSTQVSASETKSNLANTRTHHTASPKPKYDYTVNTRILIPPPRGNGSSQPYMSPEDWDKIIDSIDTPWRASTEESSTVPTKQPSPNRLETTNPDKNVTIIIIVVVTLSTVIIAAVIIVFIVYFLRKQNHSGSRSEKKSKDGQIYQNGNIKSEHKNDVLYFMPNGKAKKSDSSSESVKSGSTTKEQMTLIPGRDINHEGPLRVYKWEDF